MEVALIYDGQQASLVEEATCLKGSGQVRGPKLVTASLLGPKRSWSHHAVTASVTQRTFLSTLIP